MDQMRLILALVLCFLVFLGFNMFFGKDVQKKSAAPPKTETVLEKKPEPAAAPPKPAETAAPIEKAPTAAAPGRAPLQLKVDTPLYSVGLTERGAAIASFALKAYRETAEKNSPLKDILPADHSVESVLAGLGQSGSGVENAVFRADTDAGRISLKDGAREIVFSLKTESGLELEKVYRFSADSYIVGLELRIANPGGQSVSLRPQLSLRNAYHKKKKAYAFEGPSALIGNSLETVDIGDIAKKNSLEGAVKWVALQTHYFISAIVPSNPHEAGLRLTALGGDVVEASYVEPELSLAPGASQRYDYLLYFGPLSTKVLQQEGHELERAIHFGWFDVLARPCLWLLNFLYGIIPNYGVAIIILTVITKVLLWPLGTKSYKSMNKMKKLQPLIQEIRDKYKNDKKKMNEEVMRLHRTYNINPLGGCLPMLVQIPIFFALYRMLDQAIELRHAPFFGWITDLTAPDRLFRFDFSIPFMEPPYGIPVLTLVMGATMFLQQKMTPPAGDPTQAKMMLLMPVVFTFIFINFSSGLVLYWLVNNVLSIGQQYYTQKKAA
jgi:YidC/Oxa1 family membrane protein insertase